MDASELRPLVFEALRRNAQTHFNAIESEIKRLTTDYKRGDALKLQEILWELLVQGVLAPGKNSLNLQLPFVHVTDYGLQCLEEGSLLLHDADDYLKRLLKCTDIPMDDIVLTYAGESVLCFLVGRYFAAMMLLGTAAERCVDLLTETCLDTFSDPRKTTHFKRKARLSGRSLNPRLATLKDALLTATLPPELSENLELQLDGLFGLIRYGRDTSGHPVPQSPDREMAHAQLLLFPRYCARVFALIRHLKTDGL